MLRLSRQSARLLVTLILLLALLPIVFLDRYPAVYEDEVFYNYPVIQKAFGLGPWMIHESAPYWRDLFAYDLTLFHVLQQPVVDTFGLSLTTLRLISLIPATIAIALLCGVVLEYAGPWYAIGLAVFWVGDRSWPEAFFSRPEGGALFCLAVAYWAALRLRASGRLAHAVLAGTAATMAVTFHVATAPATLTLVAACLAFASPSARLRVFVAASCGASLPLILLGMHLWPRWMDALTQFFWHVQFVRHSTPLFTRLYWFNWTLGWARPLVWLTLAAVPVVLLLAVRLYVSARRGPDSDRLARASAMLLASSVAAAVMIGRPPYQWNPYFLLLVTPFLVVAVLLAWRQLAPGRAMSAMVLAIVAALWVPSAAQNALRVRGGFYAYTLTDPAVMRRDLEREIPKGARTTVDPAFVVPSAQVGLDIDVLPWFGEAGELPRDRWLILRGKNSDRPEIKDRVQRHLNQYPPGSKWFSAPYTIVAPATASDQQR